MGCSCSLRGGESQSYHRHGMATDYHRLARELDRREFMQRFDHPFLILGPVEAEHDWEVITGVVEKDPVEDTTRRRNTLTPDMMKQDQPVVQVVPEDDLRGILPVVKSAANPYRDRISVGRGSTCDLVLR